MPRYHGGKYRLGKQIYTEISKHIAPTDAVYVPFVGAGGVTRHFPNPVIASDANDDLIALWLAIQDGYTPPTYVSKVAYDTFKRTPTLLDHIPHYRAFVSIFCSYAGKIWGGYAKGEGRNYAHENSVGLQKLIAEFSDVAFNYGGYDTVTARNSVIYCDIPYMSTTGYKGLTFNHSEFYAWCIDMAYTYGNTIFVSEYTMPEPFTCIWSKPTKTSLAKDQYGSRVEKLFVLNAYGD